MIWAIQVTENSSTTRRVRRKLLTRSWPTGTSTTTRPHLFYQVWHSSNNFPCVFIDRYNIRKIRYQERTEEGILLEVERAGNFSARELSWAFQTLNLASWAESSFFRFWIWRAELSWAFSDFEFGELSWAELARAKRAKKRAQTEAQIIDMASWMSWIL